MFQLSRNNAREYLTKHRIVAPEQQVEIDTRFSTPESLVLSVSGARSVIGNHFELKQIRPINRGGEIWIESLERFSNETAYLEYCQTSRCPADGLKSPAVLFRDRANHLYASTGGLSRRRWDSTLGFYLRKGEGDDRLATGCGEFLARLHGTSWNDGRRVADLVDRRVFSYLCVEPCVRIARAAGILEQFIEDALDEMWNTRRALVHGRFTSESITRWERVVAASDMAHYGDPAWDVGSFVASLVRIMVTVGEDHRTNVLRMIRAFSKAYTEISMSIIGAEEYSLLHLRAMRLLAICLLLHLEKDMSLSSQNEATARSIAREMLLHPPQDWDEFEFELSRHLPIAMPLPRIWNDQDRLDFS